MEPVAPFSGLPYRLRCTLTFGDIYGQILIWMLVGVGLILVLSLPFLLFAFTTTLLNHVAFEPDAAPKRTA